MIPTGFIEVTALDDGCRSLIRAECISAIHEVAAHPIDGVMHPGHVNIDYGSVSLNVRDRYEDLLDAIYKAEL